MAKRREFKLKIGRLATEGFIATPREAAREAAKHARQLLHHPNIFDREVKLYEADRLVMTCSPSIYGYYGEARRRTARRTIARCDIAPAFKRSLKPRRRR